MITVDKRIKPCALMRPTYKRPWRRRHDDSGYEHVEWLHVSRSQPNHLAVDRVRLVDAEDQAADPQLAAR